MHAPMESQAKLWSTKRYLELSSVATVTATTEVNGDWFESVKTLTENKTIAQSSSCGKKS